MIKALFTKKRGARVQFVHEVSSYYRYPNNEDNPSDIIDDLGFPVHLYKLSETKVCLNDWYYTDTKTDEYGILQATNERLVKIANDYSAKRVVESTNPELGLPMISEEQIKEFIKNN